MTSSYFRSLILLALLLIFVCRAQQDLPEDYEGPNPEDDGELEPKDEEEDLEDQQHLGGGTLERKRKVCWWSSWRWWFQWPQSKCGNRGHPTFAQCKRWRRPQWDFVPCSSCRGTLRRQGENDDDYGADLPDYENDHQKGRLLPVLSLSPFRPKKCQIRYYCCFNRKNQ